MFVMRLIVPMAALLLVVLVGCGGESKPASSPTATSAPMAVEEGKGQPDFDLLLEAPAPGGLGTVAWPSDFQESSALFERLPSEIAGRRVRVRFEQPRLGVFSTTYGEDPATTGDEMGLTVLDLTKGDFFPTDTNAGQFVALLYAQGSDWEVLAAGREGDLAWVQWKTGPLYYMHWGNAPSSLVFQANASDLGVLMALVEAMISAARG